MSRSSSWPGALESLRLIGPDPQNWVPKRSGIDHNVAIVGGGQSGNAFAFALRRAGIGDVTVIDGASDPAHAGVWLTGARTNKLRTPKAVPGPELGLPGLSFQAWYEANQGPEAYAALDRIPRIDWAAYLNWLRETLAIPVRYGTRLRRIEPVGDHFRLHLDVDGKAIVETARKIILANGVAGGGGAYIPGVLTELPTSRYAHTSQDIDFKALRGKSVAVIGAAASAFDAAGVALESGARNVHLFAWRAAIAALPVIRLRVYPGAYDHYHGLPDEFRWRQAKRFRDAGSTPPVDAIERAVKFPNFHLHLASNWQSAAIENDQIVADTSHGILHFDFAIAATGNFVDPEVRPELSGFAHEITRWRDRFTPRAGEEDDVLGAYPYLGAAHEYLEWSPGRAPYLKDIHVFNVSKMASGCPSAAANARSTRIASLVTSAW